MREIGVLRAVGATRRHVTRLVMLEAGIVGLTAGALGAALGPLLGFMLVRSFLPNVIGITGFFRYPAGLVLVSFVSAIGLAAAAGYVPGRTAARVRIAEALEYE